MSEVPLYTVQPCCEQSRCVRRRVFKAHILLYHSTLDSRVIKQKEKFGGATLRRGWGQGASYPCWFGVAGSGFSVQCSGFRVWGSGFRFYPC